MKHAIFIFILFIFGTIAGAGGAMSLSHYHQSADPGWLVVFAAWLLTVSLVGAAFAAFVYRERK